MNDASLRRTFYILFIVAVLVYLFERAYALYQLFSHVVLLFALAWLIAYALSPLVDRLASQPLHLPTGLHSSRVVPLPRFVAVVAIYFLLFVLFVGSGVYLVPLVLEQVVQLQAALVNYVTAFPGLVAGWQTYLTEHGIDFNLARALLVETQLTGNLTQRLTEIGSLLVQNIPVILNSVFIFMFDITLITVMSFYMTLDGRDIVTRLLAYLPAGWQSDGRLFVRVINRRFGSFIRSQLAQAAIYGAGTALIMAVAGLDFIAVASVISAVLIMIPLIGGWVAIILPVLIALFHNAGIALGVYIALMLFQQLMFHIIMPRLAGTMVGLHPLVIFLALLMGFPIAGVWGSLFAIPVAGVVVSVIEFVRAKLSGVPAEEVLLPAESAPDDARSAAARELRADEARAGEPRPAEPLPGEPRPGEPYAPPPAAG